VDLCNFQIAVRVLVQGFKIVCDIWQVNLGLRLTISVELMESTVAYFLEYKPGLKYKPGL